MFCVSVCVCSVCDYVLCIWMYVYVVRVFRVFEGLYYIHSCHFQEYCKSTCFFFFLPAGCWDECIFKVAIMQVKANIVVLTSVHQNKALPSYKVPVYCIPMYMHVVHTNLFGTAVFNSKKCFVVHALFNCNVLRHCSTKLILLLIQFCGLMLF